jgi:hypothetical protein
MVVIKRQPFCAIVAGLIRSEVGRSMKRLLLIVSVGLLPLWVAIGYVVVHGTLLPHAPAYWNEAPDLIFYAMPASVVTVLVLLALIDAVERRQSR